MKNKWLLTSLILAGLVLGVIAGQILYDSNFSMKGGLSADFSGHANETILHGLWFIGNDVFMALLKMLIIPLIATSVIAGITSIGDFSKVGRIGILTILLYGATMVIAVTIGLVLVTSFSPGDDMGHAADAMMSGADYAPSQEVREQADKGFVGVVQNLVQQMIPPNFFKAMSQGKPLSVITFCLFFGIVITMVGEKAKPIVTLCNALFEVLMKMVQLVMWIAPVGVFSLLAVTVACIGLNVFTTAISKYMLVVLGGLGIHGLIILPLLMILFTRENPFRYMRDMKESLMLVFATDSSSAALPVTLDCAIKSGVSRTTAGFVIPLGSTINMDGTALYEAVAVVFIAQAFGVDLTMTQLIIVAITATLAAIGAAGIPSAGLVTMIIVVDSVNSSLSSMGATALIPVSGIGLIIGVDRILDMCRSVVNTWGDAIVAKIVDRGRWSSYRVDLRMQEGSAEE